MVSIELPSTLQGPRWADAVAVAADELHADVLLSQYWCSARCRAPQVAVVHDALSLQYPQLFTEQQRSAFAAAMSSLQWAAAVIAVSNATAFALNHPGIPPVDRVAVVRSGADHVFDEPLPCPHSHVGRSARFVAYLGRLNDRKNLDVLYAATLQREWPDDIQVALVGGADGLHRSTDKAMALLIGSGRGIQCGELEDRCAFSVLSMAGAAVYVPTAEGYGLPVVEAVALGVPVVATAVPAIFDVDRESVFVVPDRDPSALARAVADVVRRSASVRENPRTLRDVCRSWDAAAVEIVDVLEAVVAAERKS